MGSPRSTNGGLSYMSVEDIVAAQKSYFGEADGWRVNGAGERELLRPSSVADLYEGWPAMPVDETDEQLTRRMIEGYFNLGHGRREDV